MSKQRVAPGVTEHRFFGRVDAQDPLYRKIKEASTAPFPEGRFLARARRSTERMWTACSHFLDSTALERATRDFYPVWWELYLAYSLHIARIPVVPRAEWTRSPKGPDLLTRNPQVWIEAVMPGPGDGEDKLTEPLPMIAFTVPIDGFILRLCNAIHEKINKLSGYIENGMISPDDATIIAVSGGRLPHRFSEHESAPNIVRSVLAVGSPTLEINLVTKKIVGRSLEYRDQVLKKSLSPVSTDVFLRPASAHVSAVLYRWATFTDRMSKPGQEFILVHNPNARVPLHKDWLQVGRQYWLDSGERLRWSSSN